MKPRRSTVAMIVLWVGLLVLYFLVRPAPPEPVSVVPVVPAAAAHDGSAS